MATHHIQVTEVPIQTLLHPGKHIVTKVIELARYKSLMNCKEIKREIICSNFIQTRQWFLDLKVTLSYSIIKIALYKDLFYKDLFQID